VAKSTLDWLSGLGAKNMGRAIDKAVIMAKGSGLIDHPDAAGFPEKTDADL